MLTHVSALIKLNNARCLAQYMHLVNPEMIRISKGDKMTRGDLVLLKIQGKNVIGFIQYLIKDQVSINVEHSFKIQRGSYLVHRSEVKVLSFYDDSKKWMVL